ncbi:MAG: hypothetical protein AAGA75_22045 [Cyanobacteria bacterium P01_E01_bin.6]
MKFTDFLQDVDRPVQYYPKVNNITGSTLATIFISQFIYWTGKQADPDGWIYKNQEQITAETGLSRYEQQSARKVLKKLNYIEERKCGVPCRLEYRINLSGINQAWDEMLQTGQSTALTSKRKFNAKRTQNARNARNSQFSVRQKTRMLCDNRQECCATTDIYTESTNIDDFSEITKDPKEERKELTLLLTNNEFLDFDQTNEVEESKQQEEQSLTGLKQEAKTETRESNNSERSQNVPLNFSKKEKPKSAFDDNGYWLIPMKGAGYYPGKLTVRTMQLLIWALIDDAEFDYEDGQLILKDFDGCWSTEAELVKEYPLSKLKFFNELDYKHEVNFDQEWFNRIAKHFYGFWAEQLKHLDADIINGFNADLLTWLKSNSDTFKEIWKREGEYAA